jgi:hypothetical protein
MVAALAGSTAWAGATLPQAHTGGGPSSGPPQKDDTPAAFAGIRKVFGAMMMGGDYPPQLIQMLRHTTTKWSAAIERSAPAAGLELSSRTSVIAIGGFTSDDPVPALSTFQDMVRNHEVSYYIAPEITLPDAWKTSTGRGTHPRPAPVSTAAQRNSAGPVWHPVANPALYDWAAAHYPAQRMNGLVVFDLTATPH